MELKTFHHFNRLAHEITERERSESMQQVAEQADRQREFAGVLQQATADYVLTGIGRRPQSSYGAVWWMRWDQRSYFQWDYYFAGLAKDLKRPFVYTYDNHGLIVQRRRYTEPLIGSFLLTALERKDRWSHYAHDAVTYRRTTDRWYFYFDGIATKLLEHWLDECRTNPEYRRALRLA